MGCFYKWLKCYFKDVYMLKLVRNTIQTFGSFLRDKLKDQDVIRISSSLSRSHKFTYEFIEDVYTVRFEDVKLYPQKVLSYLFNTFKISCSDEYFKLIKEGNLRKCTNSDYAIQGLDLQPVYNQYEEYFSGFDIFRLNILFSSKNKAYGYSYEDIFRFSEQQILDWFKIPFKFESLIDFGGEEFKKKFRYQMYLSNIRSIELQKNIVQNEDLFSYDDYFKV